jgi:ABC-2 type transport system permease protein
MIAHIVAVARRELGAYFKSALGYTIIAAVLAVDGLLFNAMAIGTSSRTSGQVLEMFFFCASGTTLLACIFISMRLIAEEKQTGTWVLLATAPVPEWQWVFGKYLSALVFLGVMTVLTAYMPALVLVHGKISLSHIAAGYLGLMLLGSAALAWGMLCSALAPNQLVAAVLGAACITVFVLLWLLSRIASPPVEELLAYLSIHDKHFRPFMRGVISVQDVLFYVSLTYVGLLMTTRVVESRRWH